MRSLAFVALLALAAAPAGAAPSPAPVPNDDATALVRRYVGDLAAAAYADAFGLLVTSERRYHGDAAGLASVYRADGFGIERWSIVTMHAAPAGRVYFVRESIRYTDRASGVQKRLTVVSPVGTLREGGRWAIKDPGKPQRAFASEAAETAGGLRVSVRKVSLFPDRVEVIATFANVGDAPVTVLPYGKSELTSDAGAVYRIIALKDWRLTDKRLYEGLRLASGREYTGLLSFARPAGAAPAAHRYDLTIAPALRDGADEPFTVTVAVPSTDG